MKRLITYTCAGTILFTASCAKKPMPAGPPPGMKIAVRTAVVAREAVAERIGLVASISANERVEVRSPMEGTIAKIGFAEGERVAKGHVLFELDTRKWVAFYMEAEAAQRIASDNMDRANSMLNNKTISRQEYDAAVAQFKAASATFDRMTKQLEDAKIRAEFDGIVGARSVSIGQVIGAQTMLTTLVDVDPVKVDVDVPERYAGRLQVGQSISFRIAAYPGSTFNGEVYFIAPELDPGTRTIRVKAKSPNIDGRLKPGMFGNLELTLDTREGALVVSESALVPQGDTLTAFIVDDQTNAQPRRVTVGTRMAGKVEILTGLREGDMVITEGLQKIRPGAAVQPRIEKAAP